MTLSDKELLKRDADRDIGEELLQAIRDIKSGKVGRTSTVEISPIAEARHKLDLSQAEFINDVVHTAPRRGQWHP